MNPADLIVSGLAAKKQQQEAEEAQERQFTVDQFEKLAATMLKTNQELVKFLLKHEAKVEVKNFPTPQKIVDNTEKVVKAIKDIPTPELDNSEVVMAVRELIKQQETLNKLFATLDVKPEVKVEAPVVQVEAPNLKPLEQAIKDIPQPQAADMSGLEDSLKALAKEIKAVKKAVEDKPTPVAPVPQTDPLVKFAAADIEFGDVEYRGYLAADGDWYIRKYDKSGAVETVRYLFGKGSYSTNWTNRASLTYGYFGS